MNEGLKRYLGYIDPLEEARKINKIVERNNRKRGKVERQHASDPLWQYRNKTKGK